MLVWAVQVVGVAEVEPELGFLHVRLDVGAPLVVDVGQVGE